VSHTYDFTNVEFFQNFSSREDATVLEAATNGANAALPVVLGVIANLIAFVSFIAFANAILAYLGSLLGYDDVTFEFIFGKIFTPLAWAMGVDWAECEYVGQLIGLKSIVNEFVAFERLGRFKEENLINVSRFSNYDCLKFNFSSYFSESKCCNCNLCNLWFCQPQFSGNIDWGFGCTVSREKKFNHKSCCACLNLWKHSMLHDGQYCR
jgi:hypothetical protein